MSGLARSNDVATNGVNGRIGKKTWCKCECCAPVETGVEGVYCLEIIEICKRRFSSCLNVCRSDHVLCYDILGEKTSLII